MSGALRSAFSLYVKLNVGGFVGGDQRMNSQQFTKMCHDAGMMEPNGGEGVGVGQGTGLPTLSQASPLQRRQLCYWTHEVHGKHTSAQHVSPTRIRHIDPRRSPPPAGPASMSTLQISWASCKATFGSSRLQYNQFLKVRGGWGPGPGGVERRLGSGLRSAYMQLYDTDAPHPIPANAVVLKVKMPAEHKRQAAASTLPGRSRTLLSCAPRQPSTPWVPHGNLPSPVDPPAPQVLGALAAELSGDVFLLVAGLGLQLPTVPPLRNGFRKPDAGEVPKPEVVQGMGAHMAAAAAYEDYVEGGRVGGAEGGEGAWGALWGKGSAASLLGVDGALLHTEEGKCLAPAPRLPQQGSSREVAWDCIAGLQLGNPPRCSTMWVHGGV